MAIYLDAADFAAFPFRSVTNSSSVLLAQSFGLPVIIPNLDSLSDVPKDCALRYAPSEEGLGRALEQAAELSAELRSDMASAARRHAHSMDWPTVAQLHLAVYAKVLRNRLQRCRVGDRATSERAHRFGSEGRARFWAVACHSSSPSRFRETAGSKRSRRARPFTRRASVS